MVAASACSFPDPALSSRIFCPQHQMAGQCLFNTVTACLEAALIHSAASRWLGCKLRPLLLKQVPVFVVWQSCACHPKSTRQRLAAGHLCVIAEAVLEPQLLLRKAESAKSSVGLFCQVSP